MVARPIGNFKTSADYHYQTLRCNVDLLKIIQLGVTFMDERGRLPKTVCTWQFNFRFNLAYVGVCMCVLVCVCVCANVCMMQRRALTYLSTCALLLQ